MSVPEKLRAIEQQIRRGMGTAARDEIQRLLKKKISPTLAHRVSQLAWRSYIPDTGLRLLGPFVRPAGSITAEGTEAERAEYAMCLVRLGADEEALALLASLDPKKYPRVQFYIASAHMARWEYEQALPCLREFARSAAGYEKIMGRVNLAAVLVYLRYFREASYLLKELVYETAVRKYNLLHGNCLELAAYNCLIKGELKRAAEFLQEASRLVERTGTKDDLFIRKWQAVLALKGQGSNEGTLAGVEAVRSEAFQRNHGETVRDCDRFLATVTKDEALYRHLYFGTPYASFRDRLREDFGKPLKLAGDYPWKLGGESPSSPAIDLTAGTTRGGAKLKAGQAVHRLFVALCSDFYRPFRLASLFARTFPGEFFNPVTSSPRVHQTVRFLRGWFTDSKLPLDVEASDGFFRLVAKAPCLIRVSGDAVESGKQGLVLAKLRGRFGNSPFSGGEAGEALSVSSRTALRQMAPLIEEALIETLGTRKADRRYRIRTAAS